MKRLITVAIVLILGLSSAWADDWNPITPPVAPDARQGHTMVTLPDGRVFLFAGVDAQDVLMNDLSELDSYAWNAITPNNSPPPIRKDHQAWARADLMYIYGGYGENGALDDLWSYNSTTNTWQEEQISGPGPVARHGHATTTLTDGSEIIVCGTDVNGDPLNDCWKLNPDNTFTQLQDAPYAYTGHSMELSPDGEWLYVFGKPGSLGIYRTSTDRWSLVSGGPPNGPGCCTSRGVNAAGEPVVFIFGGKDINGNEMSDVYEYNLYGGELTQRGDMPQPIVNGADAQLPVVPPGKQQFGNNWLVFGGLSGGIPTNNSYAFTPISAPDTITVVSPMDSVFADSVMMIWNPAEPWQATHYQLQVASDSAMTIFFADTIVTDTSYLVKELINNTDYWWQVRGYNAGGWGPYNDPVHFLVEYVTSSDVTFINGSNTVMNYEQTSPSPPQDNWPFGQFSLSGDAQGATLNSVTVTLGGTYDSGDLGSNPFRLYANNSNNFGTATEIGIDVADPGSGSDVTFSSLNDAIPSGTRYYWVTADISGTATGDDNINGTIDGSGDLGITDGTLIESNYGKLNAGSDVSLPVELSAFTAQFIGSFPILCWTTQSEADNAGWNVYRGDYRDAFINGEAIQINPELIEGAGTTSIPTNYTFEDEYDVIQGTEYWYILESVDYSGATQIHGSVSLIIPEEGTTPELPQQTLLIGNYPNPFNPLTKIDFTVKENETAELTIYNLRGQQVEKRVFDAGDHSYVWDATEYGSGIYFYSLKSASYSRISKMIMLK